MPITDDLLRAVMRDVLKRKRAPENAGLGNVPTPPPLDPPAAPSALLTLHTELDAWRALGRRLLDPDDLGWACSQEVREQVRNVLGPR